MKINDELLPSAPPLANTMLAEVESCPTMKECTKCKIEKSVGDFNNKKDTNDGKSRTCRVCANKQTRDWCKKNPEKCSQKVYNWRNKNKERSREINQKYLEKHSKGNYPADKN